MDRHRIYIINGGNGKDNEAYRAWLADYWNKYGEELNAPKDNTGNYYFREDQKRQFNYWLFKNVKGE